MITRRQALSGVALALLSLSLPVAAGADQVFNDDLIVVGSGCFGLDCVNGHNFGFDTLVVKENNLRFYFDDTSNSASFPATDWRLLINDSTNGGGNYFGVQDATSSRTIFKLEAGSPADSFVLDDAGRLGLGTASPVLEIHVKDGDTPTLRLEQDGTSGFTAQTWDVAGNETNFFVRDATNGSVLSLRIRPAAPSSSIEVAADGDIGFGTSSPATKLHATASDSPALRLQQTGGFGAQVWDLAANESNFALRDVTAGNRLPLRVRASAPTNSLVIDEDGEVGVGTAAPLGGLHVTSDAAYPPSDIDRGQLVVENTAAGETIMLNVVNDGTVVNAYRNEANGSTWVETFGDTPDGANTAWTIGESGSPTAMEVYSSGDVRIGGTVAQGSSRRIKRGIHPVDPNAVLGKVMRLAISTWRYTADAAQAAHIGPMAEDFYAAFQLGHDDKHLAASDAAGVALASVQALGRKVEEQEVRIEALRSENAALVERLTRLEALIERQGASR